MMTFALVGAGGFGREVMPTAREAILQAHRGQTVDIVFIDDGSLPGTKINGIRVASEAEFLALEADTKIFNIAIADYAIRQRVAERFTKAGCSPFTIRASNSVVLDHNQIGEGAILCSFAMVTSNARIGRYFHANIYSYVAHDCEIGDYVTFAPGAKCNGNVVIEDYAYIGTGAILRHGLRSAPLRIGRGAVIGMGAVVTKNVAPFTTVVGNPARVLDKRPPLS